MCSCTLARPTARWAGVDVAARLPLLGAWLGHRHPASTYYYLQAAPELLALAAQRLPDLGMRS